MNTTSHPSSRHMKILLAAALTSCMALAGASSAMAQAKNPIEGEIDAAKAMAHLFGEVQTLKGSANDKPLFFRRLMGKDGGDRPLGNDCVMVASWIPPTDQGRFKEYFEGFDNYKGKTMAVCKLLDARYTEQGVEKFMLGTQALFPEALEGGLNFEPQPMLGMAIFAKEGGQWKLELEDKYVAMGSLWGVAMDWVKMQLQRTGADKHGILINEFSHAGAGCSSTSANLMMPYGDSIKDFHFGAGLTETESEGFECGGGESVRFDTASSGEYYDALVQYTIPHGNKTRKKSVRMRLQDGEYKVVKDAAGKKGGAKKR